VTHLTPDDLLDLAEGVRDPASVPHLSQCEQCRAALTELRDTMLEAAAVDVPEPSPLFWDHFSARVRDEVARESQNQAPVPFANSIRCWWRVAVPATAATAIILAAVAQFRTGHEPPVSPVSVAPPPIDLASAAAGPEQEAALALLGDLLAETTWDDVTAAGIRSGPGSLEGALNDLTSIERIELRRLLDEELAAARSPTS
jgi:hypothetical protein